MMTKQLEANSSSRRENYSPKNNNLPIHPNNNNNNTTHTNNIGCMSGIFRLVYKYNNRRHRRFLTSGKNYKQDKATTSLSLSQEEKSLPTSSCNIVPRSPTLPPEIRLSNVNHSPEDSKSSGSTAEKRRKLLQTLEKCDEELKALKKIIDVVKRTNTTVRVEDDNNGNKGAELQPSPVSVLDNFMTSPAALQIMNTYSKRYRNRNGRAMQVPQKQKQKKKPGEEEIITNICFLDRVITSESIQAKIHHHHHENVATSTLWASKAMVESVNEVCKDIAWGEKREIGRIGLALQDRICRDLIDEIVRELECCAFYSLPFEACKRSLRF